MTIVMFNHFPMMIQVTADHAISPWSAVIGLWFILRDYSQREIGHYVLIPMAIAIAIASIFSTGYAIAATLSTISSELTDWLVYTLTNRPFHERILISSLVAAPVDTLAFFWAFDAFNAIPGVSIFNWITILIAIIAKLLVAAIVWYGYHRQQVI